jgi:hypothetical protein
LLSTPAEEKATEDLAENIETVAEKEPRPEIDTRVNPISNPILVWWCNLLVFQINGGWGLI